MLALANYNLTCFTHTWHPAPFVSSWPAPSTALSGSIALVARGSCSHYNKARSAQDRNGPWPFQLGHGSYMEVS